MKWTTKWTWLYLACVLGLSAMTYGPMLTNDRDVIFRVWFLAGPPAVVALFFTPNSDSIWTAPVYLAYFALMLLPAWLWLGSQRRTRNALWHMLYAEAALVAAHTLVFISIAMAIWRA